MMVGLGDISNKAINKDTESAPLKNERSLPLMVVIQHRFFIYYLHNQTPINAPTSKSKQQTLSIVTTHKPSQH